MKLEVTQENLARALSNVSRVTSSRAGLEVLGNILLRTDGKQLYIAATNLEVASVWRIGAKIEKEGSITAPAKLISDFVSNLPKGPVSIEVENTTIHISSGQYTSTINGVSDDEFPELPAVERDTSVSFSLTVDDFKTATNQTIAAASSDATRPVLTGAFMHSFEGSLYIAATDGYRLAEKRVMDVTSDIAAIVPVSTIQEVLRSLYDGVDAIEILLDDTQVMFTIGSCDFTSRLIDGNYPNYRQLIPTSTATSAEIATAELRRVTKLAALFTRQANGGIRLSVDADNSAVEISSVASEYGENTSVIETATAGESASIVLNSRYVNDMLSAISSDKVSIGFSGEVAPCVIRPLKDDSYTHIIMPIKN